MATSQKRGYPVKALVTEATKDRLWALSETMGQAPSTLASIAISEYVARQSAAFGATDKAIKAMTDHLGPELATQLKIAMGSES
jgi:hypothetical protein